MKISITNIVALNGGDAAILLGTIKSLRKAFGENIEIFVFSTFPDICEKLYPEVKWFETLGLRADRTKYNKIRYLGRFARLIKRYKFLLAAKLMSIGIDISKLLLSTKDANAMKIYSSSDLIISTGGTYLIEPYGITTQYIDYAISLNLKRTLCFYTQSMGPFYKKSTINRLRKIFGDKRTKLLLFRDKKSFDNVHSLNLSHIPEMRIIADAAFSLGECSILERRLNEYIGTHRNVAFSVRAWNNFRHKSSDSVMESYCQAMADAAIYLIEKGFKVYYFSTCQGIDQYDNDSLVVSKIMELIPSRYHSKIINKTDYLTIHEIIQLLIQMDMIIATRLHMCILSLISGTPVLPIAYEFKTTELFERLGYDKVFYMEELGDIDFVNSIDHFMQYYDINLRENVNRNVIQYIEESQKAAEILKQFC